MRIAHAPERSPPRTNKRIALAALLCVVLLLGAGLWLWQRHATSDGQLPVRAQGPDRRLSEGAASRLQDVLEAGPQGSDLTELILEIDPDGVRVLQDQRDQALDESVLALEQAGWVAARARIDPEAVDVRIRLKPDWTDPFQKHKWPFQVRVQARSSQDGEATILGMQDFTAQSPAAHGYFNQWLYMEDLRWSGIMAPQVHFVHLKLNGEDWGTYLLREGISPELLASQGRAEGPIIHVDWSGSDAPLEQGHPSPAEFALPAVVQTDEFKAQDESSATEERSDSTWEEQRTTALGLLRSFHSRRLPAYEVFDAEQMGRYLAHANLWGARSGRQWRSEWFYADPRTMKLAPIGYDAFSSVPLDAPAAGLFDLAQYDDPEIMGAYVREVIRITQPDYLEELRSAYGRELEGIYVALAREFASLDLELPWDRLPERQERLLASLHPDQPVYAFQVTDALEGTIHLEICNLLYYPLAVEAIKLNGNEIALQAGWVPESERHLVHDTATSGLILRGVQGEVPEYVTLRIPASAIAPPGSSVSQIVVGVIGVDEPIVVDVHRDPSFELSQAGLPIQPSLEQALKQHPFLRADQADPIARLPAQATGWLALEPGTWEVEGDLILPHGYGLRATEPVTLTFAREALFYANGPLYLDGPDPEGIHLLPREAEWAGLLVLRTGPDAGSVLRNVEVRGARGIQRDGLQTRGGMTFYESPVVLDGCRLSDTGARSALHVVHAGFSLERTLFENVAGQALDADLARGNVEQCTFRNVRGNGIDGTGTTVDIRDAHFRRIYGSAILANQTSSVTARHIDAADVYAAITSQDMSLVRVTELHVVRAWTTGLIALRHELTWGTANLQASQAVFQDDSVRALAQTGSSLSVNGYEVLPKELDAGVLRHRQSTLAEMRALDYRFGSEIELLGYQLGTPEIGSGSALTLTVYWAALAEPGRDYTVFTHLLDDAGQVAVGWDNMPCLGECPTTGWLVGRLVDDIHHIPLPADLSPGEYRIALGLYALETGERLPVRGSGDEQVPSGAVVLEQRVRVKG